MYNLKEKNKTSISLHLKKIRHMPTLARHGIRGQCGTSAENPTSLKPFFFWCGGDYFSFVLV